MVIRMTIRFVCKFVSLHLDRIKTKINVFRKKHRVITMISIYLLVVLSFSMVNWMLFLRNSTSFLISEQLNKHLERYDFLETTIDLAQYHRDAKDEMPITINEFAELIKPVFDKLEVINDSLEENTKKYKRDSLILDSLNAIVKENRKEAIKTIKDNSLAKIQWSIDSLSAYMAGKDSTEMIIQGKLVELANLQYEYAKKNAQVQSYINTHYGSLIPESLSLQISYHYGNFVRVILEIIDLEDARRSVISKIRDSNMAFHKNRMESVDFMDFIYYSICVSTTVSFGDIAPNDGKTRFVAVLELLICIILVTRILDGIKKSRDIKN